MAESPVTHTRNSEVLADLVAYCKAHPQLRFWQAVRNWSGYQFILVANGQAGFKSRAAGARDTFYWEGRDG